MPLVYYCLASGLGLAIDVAGRLLLTAYAVQLQ